MSLISWMESLFQSESKLDEFIILTLLHSLWQGGLVGCIVVISCWSFKKESARSRYWVHLLGLVTLVALMPVTFYFVSRGEGIEEYVSSGLGPFKSSVQSSGGWLDLEQNRYVINESSELLSPTDPIPMTIQPDVTFEQDEALPLKSFAGAAPGVEGYTGLFQSNWSLERLSSYALTLYLLGVLVMVIRVSISLCSGKRIRKNSVLIQDRRLFESLRRQAERLKLKTAPLLAYSSDTLVPIVIGIFKPILLLPLNFTSNLSADQIESILAHELAHLKRYDLIVNLLQRFIEAVLFFNPAVWYLSRQVSIEREKACDDLVLSAGWKRIEYADALVRMAEVSEMMRKSENSGSQAALAATGTHKSQFSKRVIRVLTQAEPKGRMHRSGFLIFLFMIGSFIVTLSAAQSLANTEEKDSEGVLNDEPSALEEEPRLINENQSSEQASKIKTSALFDPEFEEPKNPLVKEPNTVTSGLRDQMIKEGNTLLSQLTANREPSKLASLKKSKTVVLWEIEVRSPGKDIIDAKKFFDKKFVWILKLKERLNLNDRSFVIEQPAWSKSMFLRAGKRTNSIELKRKVSIIQMDLKRFDEFFNLIARLSSEQVLVNFKYVDFNKLSFKTSPQPVKVVWKGRVIGSAKSLIDAKKWCDNSLSSILSAAEGWSVEAESLRVSHPSMQTKYDSKDPKKPTGYSFIKSFELSVKGMDKFEEIFEYFSKKSSEYFKFDFDFVYPRKGSLSQSILKSKRGGIKPLSSLKQRTRNQTILNALNVYNKMDHSKIKDPEILKAIRAYEEAFRLQTFLPLKEPDSKRK